MTRFETRHVLAAAYPGGRRSDPKSLLTHAVEVDDEDQDVRVLCSKVKLESLCDPGRDVDAEPTCVLCLRRRAARLTNRHRAIPLPYVAIRCTCGQFERIVPAKERSIAEADWRDHVREHA